MRIYLIGPVGVGKSYILDKLDKLGYTVHSDPIIDQNLLRKGTPYEVQIAIESALLLRDINSKDGIFDTALESAKYYTRLQFENGDINEKEYNNIQNIENIFQELLNNTDNHYIFIKRDLEEIKEQIRKRGRSYEINNQFYDRINTILLNCFNKSKENLDIITLCGTDISPVIERIEELYKSKIR